MEMYVNFFAAVIAVYCLITTLFNLRFLKGAQQFTEKEVLDEEALDEEALVSILIPARDESSSIEMCLQSLSGQTYRNLEILVLDDRSTDNTFDVVNSYGKIDSRVKVIKGSDLESGWIGKHWACNQLSGFASGDYLLFVDADTSLRPEAIRTAKILSSSQNNDLVTLMPYRSKTCVLEYFLVPFIDWIIVSWLPLKLSQKLKISFMSASFGQFMFFRRKAYLGCGGHEAVKDIPTDDMELGRRVKRTGFGWGLYAGVNLVETTSYSSTIETLLGISRSIFPALSHSFTTLILFSVCLMGLGFYPIYFIFTNLLLDYSHIGTDLGLAIVAFISILISWAMVCRSFSHGILSVPLYPLSIALMILAAFYSMVSYTFGFTAWKGRAVNVKKVRL